MLNRIKTYLENPKPEKVECVIVSDEKQDRVILSYGGEKLLWEWEIFPNGTAGLRCPGSEKALAIHPLAAEALVDEEINQFLSMEGVKNSEILYINPGGHQIEGIRMTPHELGEINFSVVFKKDKIKELYDRYLELDSLCEELVGEAISHDVLKPFLSLVNME